MPTSTDTKNIDGQKSSFSGSHRRCDHRFNHLLDLLY